MKRWLKRLPVILIVVVVLGAVAWSFVPQPVEVDTAEVTLGPMRVTVDDDGQTRVRERYVVTAPLAGVLQRIELEPGDSAVAGETVAATIEPTPPSLLDERQRSEAQARVGAAEAALRQAEAASAEAEARLAQAQVDRDRLAELVSSNAASRSEYEVAALEVQVQEAAVRGAEAARERTAFELAQAQAALEAAVGSGDPTQPFAVYSPVSGRVLRVIQESQTPVTPGQALVEVADTAELEAVVDVLSQDAVAVKPGAQVLLEQWGGDEPLRGVVRYVEPSGFTKISALGVEEQRVNVVIDLVAPEANLQLGDGYRVDARIVTWSADEVVMLPTGALFRDGDAWAAFAVVDGTARLRPLQIGHINANAAEVLEGLQPGDRVVLHPSDKITHGVAVTQRP